MAALITQPFFVMAEEESLRQVFIETPSKYAPHTWWHWRNGNINKKEAINDLRWLHDIGIGGVQVFEAGLGEAAPKDKVIEFGTKPWRKAMRASAKTASDLGMDYGITTSPGWSATGGPWVEPKDAMKKLVWSTTSVTGGGLVNQMLPRPPSVPGPYQDIPLQYLWGKDSANGDGYYADIAVLAVPFKPTAQPSWKITASDAGLPLAELNDGKFWPRLTITPNSEGQVWLEFHSEQPVAVQGITVGMPDSRGFGTPQPPLAELSYSENGIDYTVISSLDATKSMVRSTSFKPVTARYFRLTIKRNPQPGFMEQLHYAAGAKRLPFPTELKHYGLSEVILHTQPRVNRVEEKAGFAAAQDYYALANPPGQTPWAQVAEVIDITDTMDEHGNIHWQAPAGDWQVIRLGTSLTGHENGPAPKVATGLEVDKLDGKKVKQYLESYRSFYGEKASVYNGINELLSDSIESGPQNWTDDFIAQFKRLRGYDPTPWMATLTGIVLNSGHETDQFLWDYRQTISDLLTEQHYATIAEFARQQGLTYYAEALEDHRPQLGHDLDIRATADIPMAAFWFYPKGTQAKATYQMDVKGAASVASVYGRPLVAVEAMTAFGHPWAVGPKELKPAADQAFALGANRLMLHSSVHQSEGKTYSPGMTLMPLLGHYFHRNVAWAGQAKGWVDYLTRVQSVLQHGYRVTNLAYFIGEEASVTGLFGDDLPQIPTGYDVDFISANGLRELSVNDGTLGNVSGGQYRLLYLGGSSQQMTLATLKALVKFAEQGVIIAGTPPMASPSLADDIQEFDQWVEALIQSKGWQGSDSLTAVLKDKNIAPLWAFKSSNSDNLAILATRRTVASQEVLYVVNAEDKPLQGQIFVSGTYSRAELWHPVTGEQIAVAANAEEGQTHLPLALAANESVFIVLSNQQDATLPMNAESSIVPVEFNQHWHLTTDANYGTDFSGELKSLESLSQSDNAGLKYYSGPMVYRNQFTLKDDKQPLNLEVVDVGDIAEVLVNGVSQGYLWTNPYRVTITKGLRKGLNTIEIRLGNLWHNRLLQPDDGLSNTDFPKVFKQSAQLRPSGIVEPITIKQYR